MSLFTQEKENPEALSASQRLARKKDIALFFFKYAGREWAERLGLGHWIPHGHDQDLRGKAAEFREDLEKLGPTFIKLGQLLSTRADLFPPEILEQLSLLQDKVEPIPFREVEKVIENELGGSVDHLFRHFDRKPVGSASLGQVHTAVLRSGRHVAIKVQRPDIHPLIERDMSVLRDFAEWIDRKTDIGRRYRFTEVLEQFERTLMNELDYEAEAENLRRLKRNLAEFEQIIVPTPVGDFCTKHVLTMDYINGKKVTQLGPLVKGEVHGEELADTLLEAYLKQVFVDGFFHADPHPGNVFLVDASHVALIDLGMVGTFTPVLRRRLLQMLPTIYRQDSDELTDIVLEISEADEHLNRTELSRAYAAILQKSQASNLEQLGVSYLLFDVVRVSAEAGVHLPPEVTVLGRTLLHLDRIGRMLAPEFNANKSIERHINSIIERQLLRDLSPRMVFKGLLDVKDFFERLPTRINRLMDGLMTRRLGFRVDVVPEVHLLENLEKIANRITVGLILAALIIGASQLMQVQTDFRLFGYPGFAMICFLLAMTGGLILVYRIIQSDRRTRKEADRERKTV